MKLLDGISDDYRRGRHPDPKEARQIATLLGAVAKDIEP
jgi:CspA family cold shock protein